MAVAAHGLVPGLVEGAMAHQTQKVQMDEAGPAEIPSGALYEPMEAGAGVSAGRRA